MWKNKVYLVSLLLLTMFLAGCGSKVDSVKMELSTDSVDVGEQVLLTAIGYSADGNEMKLDTRARWALNPPHIGEIRAVSNGQAIFVPEAEGPDGAVKITVVVGKATDSATVRIGEKIIASRAIDFAQQGGGLVQTPTTLKYPCISQWNNGGHWLEWDLTILKSSFYTPVLMYASDSSTDVYRNMSLDGNLESNIHFPKTGGFGENPKDWKVVTLEARFIEAGNYSLKLEVPENKTGEMNLAWIALVYPKKFAEEERLVTRVNEILNF